MALPGWIVTLWPWKITPFLSQVYSGPVLGYGIGSLTLASRRIMDAQLARGNR